MTKRILGITACLAILPGLVAFADDAALRERFIKEYPPAAERLAERFKRDGTSVVTEEQNRRVSRVLGGEAVKSTERKVSRYTISRSGTNLRVDQEILADSVNDPRVASPEWVHRVWLDLGGKRSLSGRKTARDPFVTGVRERGSMTNGISMSIGSAKAPISILRDRLTDLALKPNAGAIEEISEHRADDGRNLVKVTFCYVRHAGRSELKFRGWFMVDPANEWVLDSYRWEDQLAQFAEGKLTYRRNASGEIEPELSVETFHNEKGLLLVRSWRFGEFDPKPVPAERFTMKSLGLDDEEQ